jgi:hypothetical protein
MNENIKKLLWMALAALLLLLIGGLVGWLALRPEPEIIYKPYIEVRHDTVCTVIEVPKEVIRIREVGRIVAVRDTLRDTVYSSVPFVSSLDTIVKRDTLYVSYSFPQNIFDIRYHPSPDSIITSTIDVIRYVPREKEWYEATWFWVATHTTAVLLTTLICIKTR